jgi:hypothetical protein
VNKIKIMILIMGLTAPLSSEATYFSDTIKLMKNSGIVDSETIHSNISVYYLLLDNIQKDAENKNIFHKIRRKRMLLGINDLNQRMDSQMGTIGSHLTSLFAPEIKQTLNSARSAAARHDYATVSSLVQKAKLELEEIEKN